MPDKTQIARWEERPFTGLGKRSDVLHRRVTVEAGSPKGPTHVYLEGKLEVKGEKNDGHALQGDDWQELEVYESLAEVRQVVDRTEAVPI